MSSALPSLPRASLDTGIPAAEVEPPMLRFAVSEMLGRGRDLVPVRPSPRVVVDILERLETPGLWHQEVFDEALGAFNSMARLHVDYFASVFQQTVERPMKRVHALLKRAWEEWSREQFDLLLQCFGRLVEVWCDDPNAPSWDNDDATNLFEWLLFVLLKKECVTDGTRTSVLASISDLSFAVKRQRRIHPNAVTELFASVSACVGDSSKMKNDSYFALNAVNNMVDALGLWLPEAVAKEFLPALQCMMFHSDAWNLGVTEAVRCLSYILQACSMRMLRRVLRIPGLLVGLANMIFDPRWTNVHVRQNAQTCVSLFMSQVKSCVQTVVEKVTHALDPATMSPFQIAEGLRCLHGDFVFPHKEETVALLGSKLIEVFRTRNARACGQAWMCLAHIGSSRPNYAYLTTKFRKDVEKDLNVTLGLLRGAVVAHPSENYIVLRSLLPLIRSAFEMKQLVDQVVEDLSGFSAPCDLHVHDPNQNTMREFVFGSEDDDPTKEPQMDSVLSATLFCMFERMVLAPSPNLAPWMRVALETSPQLRQCETLWVIDYFRQLAQCVGVDAPNLRPTPDEIVRRNRAWKERRNLALWRRSILRHKDRDTIPRHRRIRHSACD